MYHKSGSSYFNLSTSSRDSVDRPLTETVDLVGPRTTVVIGPIEFCLSGLRRVNGDCRDEPTDDATMSMINWQFYNEDDSIYFSPPFYFVCLFVILLYSAFVQSKSGERTRERSILWVPHFLFSISREKSYFSAPEAKLRAEGY